MFATKVAIVLCLSVVMACAKLQVGLVGGPKQIDKNEAEEFLNRSLTKLAAGDGPYFSIAYIHSATRQVVEGHLTKIDADLVERNGNTKRCNVSIWSREWLPNGIEVSFECPNEAKVIKKHSA